MRSSAAHHPEPDSAPLVFFRQWLAERNLGLVPIARPDRFEWPGPRLARVRTADGDHAVVMFGAPSGVLFDPAGAFADGVTIEEGWLLAPLDLQPPTEQPKRGGGRTRRRRRAARRSRGGGADGRGRDGLGDRTERARRRPLRRLVVSNCELKSALAAFHESAEGSSTRLEVLTRWLVRLTIALVALTAVLAALTVVLLARS